MLVIGIAGGTGSGKSTLTQKLSGSFAPHTTVLSHDDYYKAHDDMTYEERTHLNYDEPDALDNDLFIEHLKKLRSGVPIDRPVYDFTQHNRSGKTVRVEPNKVLIVEGILIFADPRVCELFDIKVFVDADADTRLIRRIRRDVNERGRTLESVLSQFENTVKPMHDKYVQPSRAAADIVVLRGGENRVAFELVNNFIEMKVNQAK